MTDSRTLYGMAEGVKFRRDVSCLEFAFKPLRMIHVDVPGPDGKLERKLVWYMVYSVRNTGETMKPDEQEGGVFTDRRRQGRAGAIHSQLRARVARSDGRRPADPKVVSRSRDPGRLRRDPSPRGSRSHALEQHPNGRADSRARRRPRGQPRVGRGHLDRRRSADRFLFGLRRRAHERLSLGRPGRGVQGRRPARHRPQFTRKTLQLNFWRPGDEHLQDEKEIRFGVARGKGDLYDVSEGVAYRWVYR